MFRFFKMDKSKWPLLISIMSGKATCNIPIINNKKINKILYCKSVFCEMEGKFNNWINHPINIGKNVINIAFSTDGIIVTNIEAIESQMLQIILS